MFKSEFGFGDLLQDNVTGFRGVVMGISFYSTGCTHYGLLAQDLKDKVPTEWQWLDGSRVSLVDGQVVSFEKDVVRDEPPGGPQPNAPEM